MPDTVLGTTEASKNTSDADPALSFQFARASGGHY